MNNEENTILKNYTPAWEGKTEKGVVKRIFVIIGKIAQKTYRRFLDINGIWLSDKNNNKLLIQK